MSTALAEVTTDDLRAALDARDSAGIDTVLMNLIATVSSSADARLIARTRAAVERLCSSETVGEVDAVKLGRAVSALGLALTRLRVSAAAERSNREGGALAREIREALVEPARPKDLIERTGADPAQVARALRKLEDAGEVARVTSPTVDGRERWYRLCSAAEEVQPTSAFPVIHDLSPKDIKRLLREVAPIKELRERGCISDTADPLQQAIDVAALYRIGNLYEVPSFALAARRSKSTTSMSPAHTAWVACVRRRGESTPVGSYDRDALHQLASELPRRLQTGTENVKMLVPWLAECGVALAVEPGFSGAKLDGVAVVGANGKRIVGLSIRLDRFDSFVFTLLHELAHILNGDIDSPEQICVDAAIDKAIDSPEQERAANDLASALLFPNGLQIPARLTSQWVVAAAREWEVHPSIVIGHVQHERDDWKILSGQVLTVRHEFEGSW